jgi:NAD-dependent SIR2 family protein deacetylase
VEPKVTPQNAERVLHWLDDATHVLVGAGAGMSVDAGFDYTSEAQFVRRFPVMSRRGPRCRYHMFGFPWPSPALQWGHLARHLEEVRFSTIPDRTPYDQLNALTAGKERFVYTSNADDLFERTGFDVDRIFTPQGSYSRLQCLSSCKPTSTWASEPWVRAALPAINLQTEELTDPSLIPQCPSCGRAAMMNVRGGDWFIEQPYQAQAERFRAWLAQTQGGRLLVLDVGTGFNTPSVIRWPCERLANQHPSANMVRVNVGHPELPPELGANAFGIADSGAALFGAMTALR